MIDNQKFTIKINKFCRLRIEYLKFVSNLPFIFNSRRICVRNFSLKIELKHKKFDD